ncbi:hypothetical protein Rs2_29179 [Raphanus sativus]|nr:hypothetical protein Rs2_29179 [Raphanus sativus]
MIADVPALKEEVVQNVPVVVVDSESENDSPRSGSGRRAEGSAPQEQPIAMARYMLIPGHAKEEMFNGGLTAADISRLRGDKQKEKEAKDNQEKEKQDKENANDSMEADDFEKQSRFSSLANLVAGQIRDELLGMETRVLAAFHAQVETE